MEPHSENQTVVPLGINEYIRTNFKDDFLTEIRPFTDKSGHVAWFVDVTHDSTVFHLRFNNDGLLMEQREDPIGYPGEDVEIGEAD